MSVTEIKAFIESQILQALQGASVENHKLDFKRSWYNLQSEEGINEFLKDLTALINSYGGADAFLIIGYDDKERKFYPSKFAESGLTNDAELIGIIKRRVDRPFNLQMIEYHFEEGTQSSDLTILHLPPSLDKPHVIREYKKGNSIFYNEIFIRKDRNCERASRADIDLMYAEKPAIQVERKAIFTFRTNHLRLVPNFEEKKLFLKSHVAIENVGFKPFAINSINLRIYGQTPFKDQNKFTMVLHRLVENNGFFPVIVPDAIHRFIIEFQTAILMHKEDEDIFVRFLQQGFLDRTTSIEEVRLVLSNGETLFPRITFVDY
jgi:hypothetical protein